MAEAELHFCRVRQKDSHEPFMDPTADIVEVVNQAFKEIPVLFKDVLQEEEIDYLRSITKVMSTRVEEDKAPLDEQLGAFFGALNKIHYCKRHKIIESFALYILCRYMLQLRRDGQVDKDDRERMRASSSLLALLSYLNQDTAKAVKEQVKKEVVDYMTDPTVTVRTVDAVCIEDNSKTVNDIKDLAASAMGATGSNKWEDVARACDKYVTEAEKDSDKVIAAALAYPDYSTPYFELGVTDDR